MRSFGLVGLDVQPSWARQAMTAQTPEYPDHDDQTLRQEAMPLEGTVAGDSDLDEDLEI